MRFYFVVALSKEDTFLYFPIREFNMVKELPR